jgi:hypothetical protein
MSDEAPLAAPPPPQAQHPGGPTGFDDPAAIQQRVNFTVRPPAEQEFLTLNVSDLRLRLRELEQAVLDREAWKAPASSALGVLSALMTVIAAGSSFALVWGQDTWKGILGLALALSVWRAILGAVRAWPWKGKTIVEDAIKALGGRDTKLSHPHSHSLARGDRHPAAP